MCTFPDGWEETGVKRKEFLALFQTQTTVDPYTGKESKKAVYIGPVYRISMEEAVVKRTVRKMLVLWLISLAVFILVGTVNAESSRCFYVFPFYAAALFPLLYWGMGALRLLRQKVCFTEVDRDAGLGRLHRSALGFVVIAALHTLADGVFLALGGAGEKPAAEMIALLGVVLSGLGAAGSLRLLGPLEEACKKE